MIHFFTFWITLWRGIKHLYAWWEPQFPGMWRPVCIAMFVCCFVQLMCAVIGLVGGLCVLLGRLH